MAINPTFTHTDVLSKVQIGDTTYYFKDLDLRELVSGFGTATAQDAATAAISEDTKTSADLASIAQVYTFVKDEVADLSGAMHFLGIKDSIPDTGKAGDVVVVGTKEYVYGSTGWKELGDEGLWVPNTRTIASLALTGDISKESLQSALELKALAYVDTASVELDDYATGVQSVSYTPAGSIDLDTDETDTAASLTKANYQPTGNVNIAAGTAAAVSYDKTTSVTVSGATITEGQTANYTPDGTVEITNITVTPATDDVAVVTNAGTGYQLSNTGNATRKEDTVAQFAQAGVTVTVDTTDTEKLVITAATTANAVTASGDIEYTAPELTGALPTFSTKNVVTGITSSTGTASFSGKGALLTATANTTATDASVTQPTFTATFVGDTATDALVTGVTYKKVGVNGATFDGTQATIAPTLITGRKTVTVSADGE